MQASDRVYSRLFKSEVSISEIVENGMAKGNVSQLLNFLIDALMQNPENSTIRYYLTFFI